jgi:parallel beta-helix repeat protein
MAGAAGRTRPGAEVDRGQLQRRIHLVNNGILAVRVSSNDANFNDRGIVLDGTSRAIVDRNRLVDNTTAGIEVDAMSSGNTLVRNTVSGSVTDVSDAGNGNCWVNNTFGTGSVPPCP